MATEKVGGVKKDKIPVLEIASSARDIIAGLSLVRAQKAALEKIEKAMLEQLKPLVDPDFAIHPDTTLGCSNFTVVRSTGVSRTISGELLLERGVPPDIIQYATKSTPYFKYLIKER